MKLYVKENLLSCLIKNEYKADPNKILYKLGISRVFVYRSIAIYINTSSVENRKRVNIIFFFKCYT